MDLAARLPSPTPFQFEGRNVRHVEQGTAQTMSSLEIAELVESRHDNVKRTVERLAERGGEIMTSFPVTQQIARILAASSCDLGDERDVFRTLRAAGIPDGDILVLSDEATEAARAIRIDNARIE